MPTFVYFWGRSTFLSREPDVSGWFTVCQATVFGVGDFNQLSLGLEIKEQWEGRKLDEYIGEVQAIGVESFTWSQMFKTFFDITCNSELGEVSSWDRKTTCWVHSGRTGRRLNINPDDKQEYRDTGLAPQVNLGYAAL